MVWVALREAATSLDAQAMVMALLQTCIEPLDDVGAFSELLEMGEFDHAAGLLSEPRFASRFSKAQVDSLQRRLQSARLEKSQAIEMKVFVITNRTRRLPSERRPDIDTGVEEVRRLARRRARDAEAAIELLEEEIGSIEQRWVEDIRNRVATDNNLEKGISAAQWRATIEGYIDSGDLQLADVSARGEVYSRESSLLPPRRPKWPYEGGVSTQEALGWFSGHDEKFPRPPTFDREWGVAAGDRAAIALLDSLIELEAARPLVSEGAVERFVTAIEAAVGFNPSINLSVPSLRTCEATLSDGSVGKVVATQIGGLQIAGLYALATPDETDRVPFIVSVRFPPPEGPANSSSAEVDETDDESGLKGPSGMPISRDEQIPSDGQLAILCGPSPADRPADLNLELRIEDLFSILGDSEHRQLNLVRAVMSRLPLRLAMPEAFPPPSGDFVQGREHPLAVCTSEPRPVLLTGPPKIGRTAVLRRLEREFRANGLMLISVKERADKELAPIIEAREASTALIVCDDLQTCSVGESARAIAALAAAQESGVRVVATASSEFAWENTLALQGWRTEPLRAMSPESVHETVLRLLDLLGVEFKGPSVLDRFVHEVGGHPGLMHLLLWELLHRLDTGPRLGRVRITSDALRSAFDSGTFRNEARGLLLSPLDAFPTLGLVLASLILSQASARDAAPVRLADVAAWSALVDLHVSLPQVGRALRRLEDCQLAEENGDGQWRLPRTGIGSLVVDLVGDPSAYLEACAARCRKWPDGRLADLEA